MALIDEGKLRKSNLERLADDPDISVSMSAEDLKARLYGAGANA